MEQSLSKRNPRWMLAAFTACAIAAISLFFIPAFIIRPFRHQAPRALLLSMALRQRAPLGTLIAALACFALAFVLWRTASRWRKALLALTLLIVAFSAVMARLNYFEWMFPLEWTGPGWNSPRVYKHVLAYGLITCNSAGSS